MLNLGARPSHGSHFGGPKSELTLALAQTAQCLTSDCIQYGRVLEKHGGKGPHSVCQVLWLKLWDTLDGSLCQGLQQRKVLEPDVGKRPCCVGKLLRWEFADAAFCPAAQGLHYCAVHDSNPGKRPRSVRYIPWLKLAHHALHLHSNELKHILTAVAKLGKRPCDHCQISRLSLVARTCLRHGCGYGIQQLAIPDSEPS